MKGIEIQNELQWNELQKMKFSSYFPLDEILLEMGSFEQKRTNQSFRY